MLTVLNEIVKERENQDAQWGGSSHDDEHSSEDFAFFIELQLLKCQKGKNDQTRERLIKIAALAVAAIQSIDRIANQSTQVKDGI